MSVVLEAHDLKRHYRIGGGILSPVATLKAVDGASFVLERGKTFYYYNAGYDLDWANKSVGLVLIGLSIRAAIARGNTLYDFLRGEETYKFDWSNSQEKLITVKLNRPNLLVSVNQTFEDLWIFVRDSAKSLLPAETALKLQNFRRNWLRNRKAREV